MSVTVPRGPQPDADDDLRLFYEALTRYTADHPGSSAEVYRYGKYLIRVRVTDPSMANVPDGDRERAVWAYLEPLPEEVVNDLYTLLVITPEEKAKSRASLDFDDPLPARM